MGRNLTTQALKLITKEMKNYLFCKKKIIFVLVTGFSFKSLYMALSVCFECPFSGVLTTIEKNCEFDLSDAWKFVFQIGGQAGTAEATFQTVAHWTGLKAALDATKVVVTPRLNDGEIGEASPIELSGYNQSSEVAGYQDQRVNALVRMPDSASYKSMKALACAPFLSFAWIGTNNKITVKENGGSPVFIPIDSRVSVSPPKRPTGNPLDLMISFNLGETWFEDLKSYALTDGEAKYHI